MEKRYYELEEPVAVDNDFGRVAYYPNAQKFQLSRPAWIDENGETRKGKTVTIPVFRFRGSELKQILEMVIADL